MEAVYQDIVKENQYQPFNGMVLTDTFQLYEQDRDMVANLLQTIPIEGRHKKSAILLWLLAIRLILLGKSSANDNAANITYPNLDRIEETYADASSATLKNSLYDSYIRAFRWASDRLSLVL